MAVAGGPMKRIEPGIANGTDAKLLRMKLKQVSATHLGGITGIKRRRKVPGKLAMTGVPQIPRERKRPRTTDGQQRIRIEAVRGHLFVQRISSLILLFPT